MRRALACLAVLSLSAAHAESVTGSIGISAEVVESCSFYRGTIAMLTYSAAAGTISSSEGTAFFNCSAGVTPTYTLANGQAADQVVLSNGSGGELTVDVAISTSDSSSVTVSVSARAGQKDAPAGAYSGVVDVIATY